jgi:MFS family permease
VIWAVAATYFFYDYLQQVAPGILGPSLVASFHVDAGALGTLSAFYFYSYAVMQIPVGLLVDHFGPHRPLVIAALVAAAGNVVLALSGSLGAAELSRMLIGFGAAFSYVGCLKLVSNWFSAGRFATLAGLTSTLGMTGAIVGSAPLADAAQHLGWRGTIWVLAMIGGLLALLILVVVRNHPSGRDPWAESSGQSRGLVKTWQDLKHVFSRGQAWITGLFVTCMNITFTAFGGVWGVSFVHKAHQVDEVAAAGAVSMLFVGGIAGGVFWGWLSDRIARRKWPMTASAAGALVTMAAVLYVPHWPLLALYPLLLVQGFCCNGLILGYAVAHDIRPPGSAGASVGFVNTCCAGGTAIFLPIIGWLSEVNQAGGLTSALTAGDYRFALSFLMVCLAAAVAASLLVGETRCRSVYDATADPVGN